MTSRDFCYWLQGFFEVNHAGLAERESAQLTGISLNPKQVACIQNHLNMVFKHDIDPSHGDAAHQAVLSQAHQGGGGAAQPGKSLLEALDQAGLFTGAEGTVALNC